VVDSTAPASTFATIQLNYAVKVIIRKKGVIEMRVPGLECNHCGTRYAGLTGPCPSCGKKTAQKLINSGNDEKVKAVETKLDAHLDTPEIRFAQIVESIREEIRAYGPGYPWWWLMNKKSTLEGVADIVGWPAFRTAMDSIENEPNVFYGSAADWEAAGYADKAKEGK
jgi:hypothetical protein